MPVIPAMKEVEIGRIMLPGQPRPKNKKRKVCKTLSQQKKLGVMACSCHPSYGRKQNRRNPNQYNLGKGKTLPPK
jgi:hypothetical protein